MKELFRDLFRNQIALALIVFVVIVIGAYWRVPGDAKEITIQVITAIGSLVTGYVMGSEKNKRSTDISQTDSTITSKTTTTEGETL